MVCVRMALPMLRQLILTRARIGACAGGVRAAKHTVKHERAARSRIRLHSWRHYADAKAMLRAWIGRHNERLARVESRGHQPPALLHAVYCGAGGHTCSCTMSSYRVSCALYCTARHMNCELALTWFEACVCSAHMQMSACACMHACVRCDCIHSAYISM